MKESRFLELKEDVTNSFLKTVSAFANYGTGEIKFGITDNGVVVGIKNAEQVCLDIENKINDSIDPVPDFNLSINRKTSVITLTVHEGLHKPYFYKTKAYRRNETSTIPIDRLETTRLILEGKGISFEELPSKAHKLSFSILEKKIKATLNIKSVTKDTLKTLEIFSDEDGYNNAGELLADKNKFCGIDMVRFKDDNINILLNRETIEHTSILEQYEKAVKFYRSYYQYDEIKGSTRETISILPEEAYREAIVNALVHRTWDIDAHINVAMFGDRIEITSPGGLPRGINTKEFLQGGVSILRNRIIGNIFYRLHLVEHFGTGIRRILDVYKNSTRKPIFDVSENLVKIILPTIQEKITLSSDENKVYLAVRGRTVSSSGVMSKTGLKKTKTNKILNELVKLGYIQSSGTGRGIKYSTT